MNMDYRMKQSIIFGFIVGFVVFTMFYYLDHSLKYLLFVPFGGAMGWATQYVKRDE